MGFRSFKNFIFKELILPKVLIIDSPGVIISKRISKFSKKSSMMRAVYVFEKFAVDLYNGTVEAIGKEKADLLWYKISKNSAIRYMMFSGETKIPKFLISSVLKYVFTSLSCLGISFAEEFEFEGKSIVTRGKNCLICRKNKSSCIPAGTLSAVWSYVHGENIEAEAHCGNCPNECKIVSNKNILNKYEVNYDALKPMKNYNLMNFKINNPMSGHGGVSFRDLVKFGKIKCDDKKHIFYFNGKGIAYIEVGLLELIYEGYKEFKCEDLFNKILVKSSEDLMGDFCSGNIKKDFHLMESFLSAFGWGVPIRFQKNRRIKYSFVCPPVSRYPPVFRATVLNGFLNCILKKKLRIEKACALEMVFEES